MAAWQPTEADLEALRAFGSRLKGYENTAGTAPSKESRKAVARIFELLLGDVLEGFGEPLGAVTAGASTSDHGASKGKSAAVETLVRATALAPFRPDRVSGSSHQRGQQLIRLALFAGPTMYSEGHASKSTGISPLFGLSGANGAARYPSTDELIKTLVLTYCVTLPKGEPGTLSAKGKRDPRWYGAINELATTIEAALGKPAGLVNHSGTYLATYPTLITGAELERDPRGAVDRLREEIGSLATGIQRLYAGYGDELHRQLLEIGFIHPRDLPAREAEPGAGPAEATAGTSARASLELPPLVARIRRALLAKPFLLLPGVSGTGKTQLARRLAGWSALAGGLGPLGRPDDVLQDALATEAEGGIHGLRRPELGAKEEARVAFLPVRPDWTEASQFWGHYNPLTDRYYPTEATRVVLHAWRSFVADPGSEEGQRERGPTHFLILDEMNLARVEHYFSDLLSLMESPPEWAGGRWSQGELARLHDFAHPLRTSAAPDIPRVPEGWNSPAHLTGTGRGELARTDLMDSFGRDWIPPFVAFPPNLAIIGTVNIDETTHAFSPKVLDRAFVVEFLDVGVPGLKPPADAQNVDSGKTVAQVCQELNRILRPARLHFGKRVEREMLGFLREDDATTAKMMRPDLDFLLVSKILPKLRGTQNELERVLWKLLYFCHPAPWSETFKGLQPGQFDTLESLAEALRPRAATGGAAAEGSDAAASSQTVPATFDLPHSAEKLRDMVRRLFDTGFTSFL